jgi:hypothetical protein
MATNVSFPFCKYDPDNYENRSFLAPTMCRPTQRNPTASWRGVDGSLPSCGYQTLNPQLYQNNAACDFCPVEKKNNPCQRTRGFTAEDARLKQPRTGNIPLVLNTTPMDMSVMEDKVYSSELNKWTTGFKRYSEMDQGQITYYLDANIAGPFHNPLYENNADVSGYVEVNPMNSIQPRYVRKPTKCRNCLETAACKCSYNGGLSWIEDSNEQREDIMASQMGKANREKWSARWATSMKTK